MNLIKLKLSNSEYVKIIASENINWAEIDFCCSNIIAYFMDNKNEHFAIGRETAGDFFIPLIGNFKKTINNKLKLHESIIQNLGFMENEYCHDLPHEKIKFFMVPMITGQGTYWIGSNYGVWNFSDKNVNPYINTWLYNDSEGNIIFEVTPLYKWSFLPDDLQDPNFVTYEEFMKDYKPLIHRVIPKKVAIKWLKQTMKVYRGFFSSEENYLNMCKKLGW